MYANIGEIIAANEAAGYTWFGADEMRAFGTRVLSEVYGGRFFVTYDTDGEAISGYTVRVCDDDGDVHTATDSAGICGYADAYDAQEAARKLAHAW